MEFDAALKYRYIECMGTHTLIIISLILIICGAIFFDYRVAGTLYWPFWVVCVVLAIVTTLFVWKTTSWPIQLAYIAIFLFLLVALRFVNLSPIKQFRLFYHRLEPRLERSEVLLILDRYFPTSGKYKRPTITSNNGDLMVLILDTDDGRYDSEMLYIYFENGRLKNKDYYPD